MELRYRIENQTKSIVELNGTQTKWRGNQLLQNRTIKPDRICFIEYLEMNIGELCSHVCQRFWLNESLEQFHAGDTRTTKYNVNWRIHLSVLMYSINLEISVEASALKIIQKHFEITSRQTHLLVKLHHVFQWEVMWCLENSVLRCCVRGKVRESRLRSSWEIWCLPLKPFRAMNLRKTPNLIPLAEVNRGEDEWKLIKIIYSQL